jgi:hypothetical protein
VDAVFVGNLKDDINIYVDKMNKTNNIKPNGMKDPLTKTLKRLKELDLVESGIDSSGRSRYQVTDLGIKKKTKDIFPSTDFSI